MIRKERTMLLLKSNYTAEDYWNLPEGERAELIDGQIYNMAPPSQFHQELSFQISRIIGNYIADQRGSSKVLPAPFAVNLNANDTTYVEPDISVVCDPQKLDGYRCNGAPDLIIEIVSPSSRKHDYVTKASLYLNANVREYWIVDPAKQCTTVYHFEEDAAPTIVPFSIPLTVHIFKDLTITVSELIQ